MPWTTSRHAATRARSSWTSTARRPRRLGHWPDSSWPCRPDTTSSARTSSRGMRTRARPSGWSRWCCPWPGGGACGPGSALRLDDDRDLGGHPREHLDRHLVGAERLERLLEVDLVAVDLDAPAGERVGDVLGRDRAV